MSLEIQINNDIKLAMKARESKKLAALRAVKSAILLAKTEKGGAGELQEDVEMKILQKLAKQRKDSSVLYKEQGRNDLYEEEMFQLKVIEAYLPEQMTEAEIRRIIGEIIEQSGASSIKEMGKVMGMASKQLAGKAENKIIATIVKELLS